MEFAIPVQQSCPIPMGRDLLPNRGVVALAEDQLGVVLRSSCIPGHRDSGKTAGIDQIF